VKVFLWIIIIVTGFFTACNQPLRVVQEKKEYPLHTGDIDFDLAIDGPNFKICQPKYSLQHYGPYGEGWHILYEGDKYELMREIKDRFQEKEMTGQTGYYTTRFLVNCEGDTGLFRVESMDKHYKSFEFNTGISKQLDEIIRGLKGWLPRKKGDKTYNYYMYITIKLEDGKIEKILS